MKAISIQKNNLKELRAALQDNMIDGRLSGNSRFKPTLAIAFASVAQDIDALGACLHELGVEVFGATTNGEFVGPETGKESIAVLLLDMDRDDFEIYFKSFEGNNYRECTRRIAKEALTRFDRPAFLIAGSHMETDAEQLLLGFEDAVGKEVNVFGGMAGDDFSFTEQFVFTHDQKSSQGVVCLAIDEEKIALAGHAICGWKAMGTEKTVTKSVGNHVYTIDGAPALDVVAKYGGIKNLTPDNLNLLMEMATLCPLQLQREKGPPVMRPGLIVNWDDRSFFCSGTVPQGSKVKFSLPPDFDAIEEVVHGLKELKKTAMPEADALVYFCCAGRLMTFGPLIKKEIEGVQEVWNVPMAGIFSNAELGRSIGGNLEMHNLSSCCVAIRERNQNG